ncbi:signal peptide protein [Rhodopirellula maiorica SM1]|uniref:Signal peptide protein n=1 Tax=Rhodopirellula maiorica SM1 TaxID=1265738 RepID=M5RP70_9BACT|nr:signal peptide protein [Rhodopirellula maiorica SM1]
MFRTIAEAQLEREQRNRLPTQPAQPVPPRQGNPNQPTNVEIAPSPFPNRTEANRGNAATQIPRINVRSREAADFAQELVDFYVTVDRLVIDLREHSVRTPSIRPLLPQAYRIAADARTLIQSCDNLAALQPIALPYSELDSRWRQLSFNLRSLDQLDSECTSSIRRADQLVASMERRLGIGPQFDRSQLRDLMIVASTCMETLIDDLQLAAISSRDAETLTHDCRLLQQKLLSQAQSVAEGSYEDVVSRFTEFVGQWSPLGRRVAAINDRHLNRRLDRIRDVANQTYALLWIPPPTSAVDVRAASVRLESSVSNLMDQLTLRSMVALNPSEQIHVMEASRRLYEQCRQLETATARNASIRDLATTFKKIDSDWNTLRASYIQMRTLPNSAIVEIDSVCEQLRQALNVSASSGTPVDLATLVQAAASLEGHAEYLDADVQRFSRYINSQSRRNLLVDGSKDFYIHAKRLHSQLTSRADFGELQREASHLMDSWQQLSSEINNLQRNGVPQRSAEMLQRAHREMVPFVAQLGAALIQR